MSKEPKQRVVKQCIAELIEHGFRITVNDGEDNVVEKSQDAAAIFSSMFSTDEDFFFIYPVNSDTRFGWIRFTHGNAEWEAISDYTCNMDPYLEKTNALSEELERKYWETH